MNIKVSVVFSSKYHAIEQSNPLPKIKWLYLQVLTPFLSYSQRNESFPDSEIVKERQKRTMIFTLKR